MMVLLKHYIKCSPFTNAPIEMPNLNFLLNWFLAGPSSCSEGCKKKMRGGKAITWLGAWPVSWKRRSELYSDFTNVLFKYLAHTFKTKKKSIYTENSVVSSLLAAFLLFKCSVKNLWIKPVPGWALIMLGWRQKNKKKTRWCQIF